MRKAYSYIRFSSKRQEAGDTIRRQTEASRAYCKRMGFTLTELMPDKGISARHGLNRVRGSLAAFLALIKSGIVKSGEILVVESLDRLSRQEPLEAFDLFGKLIRAGIEIHTLTPEGIYSANTIKKNPAILHLVLAFSQRAHEESETKSVRVREQFADKLAKARKATRQIHGKPPGWIDIEKGKPILNKHVATVRLIVKWALAGLGPVAICKRLNQEGYPSMSRKTRDGKPICQVWEFSAVQNILTTKRIVGEYQPTHLVNGKREPLGDPIEGYYPAVVSKATYYKLQAVLAVRKLNVRGRQTNKIPNLFGRLLTCGNDTYKIDGFKQCMPGTMVLTTKRKGKTNMVSINAVRGLTKYTSFDYKVFEAAFLKWVTEIKITPQPFADDSTEAKGRLAENEKKLATLKAKLLDSPDFKAGLELLQTLENKSKEYRRTIDESATARAAPPDTHQIARLLADPNTDQQMFRSQLRSAIANCVRKIIVWIEGTHLRRELRAGVWLADGYERQFDIVCERNKRARLDPALAQNQDTG